MTLQLSGVMTSQQIKDELRKSSSLQIIPATMNDMRWLAERSTGQNVIWPTHFYGKKAIKYCGAAQGTGGPTTWTFTNIPLGEKFTGRKLIFFIECWGKASADTTGWTIGGTINGLTIGTPAATWVQGGSASTRFIGGRLAGIATDPAGTTCNASITTGQDVVNCRIWVISGANFGASADGTLASAYAIAGIPSITAPNITTTSNGLIVVAAMVQSNTTPLSDGDLVFSGGAIPLIGDDASSGGYFTAIGFVNRKSASAANVVNANWGGTQDMALILGGAI